MKIIIPMSGSGRRFAEAGYKDPKPLIEVEGKPIIEHVVNLFPGEKEFIFICNSIHLKETKMRTILKRIAPHGRIVEIEPHKKGPVYAVSLVQDLIHEEEEVIVNYCDFFTYWDYQDFLRNTRDRNADGAIPSYKGFHPHMLSSTNYAFMRDEEQWMLEIQEKKPFTSDRSQEYASNGTYYFKKGAYIKEYFMELLAKDLNLDGEFYVSMVYNLLARDRLKVSIYEVQHMLQWGTPRDLEEYLKWSSYFKKVISPSGELKAEKKSLLLMPLAGRGNRFVKEGYSDPKPLIEVGGKPMVIQAAANLPPSEKQLFVCLSDHLDNYSLERSIKKEFKKASIVRIDEVTQGQASTCELGLKNEDLDSPLLIGACDNGVLYNKQKYQALLNDETVDAIVWSFRHHPSSEQNPQMYGWVRVDAENNITGVSVKVPVSKDPFNDHAIAGVFYFRNARFFLDALHTLYEKNERVNNEFYVDSCINELLNNQRKVKVFEVIDYVGWGTPNDLRTYEYWQSYFHKWDGHPYQLKSDPFMSPDKISTYDQKYRQFEQKNK